MNLTEVVIENATMESNTKWIGSQMKLRAATSAAEAWNTLKETCEGQTRVHLTSLLNHTIKLQYDDRKDGILSEHITKFEAHWLKLAQPAVAGSMNGEIEPTKLRRAESALHPRLPKKAAISHGNCK